MDTRTEREITTYQACMSVSRIVICAEHVLFMEQKLQHILQTNPSALPFNEVLPSILLLCLLLILCSSPKIYVCQLNCDHGIGWIFNFSWLEQLIYCNIGNPHSLGQQQITFFREVYLNLSLLICVDLVSNLFVLSALYNNTRFDRCCILIDVWLVLIWKV
jgi:hypothetical protein